MIHNWLLEYHIYLTGRNGRRTEIIKFKLVYKQDC